MRQNLIQIEIEPKNAGWTFPCNHVVLGDAEVALAQISSVIRDSGPLPDEIVASRKEMVQAAKRKFGF